MEHKLFDLDQYAACARQVVAEGCVLLKNDRDALPLRKGAKIALFGRSQYNYYKSGTGSGGMVNVRHVVDIPEALGTSYAVNQQVRSAYEAWLQDHPYDSGSGWGGEPWFQEEMPLDDALIRQAAEDSDAAVIVLGRSSGEDQDNKPEPGSFLLTALEEDMLRKVCGSFQRSIVLLNVGNIIDMKCVEKYDPAAVLYVWQGGQEGGNGVLDVLDGTVTPCGKLSDTIAVDITDYPSTANYGGQNENVYQEDIYAGYRYFETFRKDRVLYPFGFGLSYTSFDIQARPMMDNGNALCVAADVTNTGPVHGKAVVQVYVEKPQGTLGQPLRTLCGYVKTRDLQPGETESVTIDFDWYRIASYDDSGCTGNPSCYVLEAGEYQFYMGQDVRSAALVSGIYREGTVIRKLEEALAPQQPFSRVFPKQQPDGSFLAVYQKTPARSVPPMDRRARNLPAEYACTGDKGIKLVDVREGRASMADFVAQLGDEDLCALTRGEGMSSPKVTPGTGGAFGGVTDELRRFGIPVACCTDGPSGIRMDVGTKAFSLPSGTCMACTFNDALVEELFRWEGLELRKNKIDALLGPGLNLHRKPLCGRNFEYFSEDPLLSGKMAAAQLRGMHSCGVTGVIKHFACNNQEYRRNMVNSVVSERALRELYLKGFEIAVKEGNARCVMSSYNPLGGIYTASNYDLLTTVLRKEWGFAGVVMTDWWAKGGEEGEPGSSQNTAPMIRAQNDLVMVVTDAASNSGDDNTLEGLQSGVITRGELQRSAANILSVILTLPVMDRFLGIESEMDRELAKCRTEEDEFFSNVIPVRTRDGRASIAPELVDTGMGKTTLFQVFTNPRGPYRLSITCRSAGENSMAQIPLTIFQEKWVSGMVTLTGADTEFRTCDVMLEPAFMGSFYLKLYFGQSGMDISRITLQNEKDMEDEITKILSEFQG